VSDYIGADTEVGSPEKVNLKSALKIDTRLNPQPDHHAAAI